MEIDIMEDDILDQIKHNALEFIKAVSRDILVDMPTADLLDNVRGMAIQHATQYTLYKGICDGVVDMAGYDSQEGPVIASKSSHKRIEEARKRKKLNKMLFIKYFKLMSTIEYKLGVEPMDFNKLYMGDIIEKEEEDDTESSSEENQ